MKRMITRLALVAGIATAALLFTAGSGGGVEAAAYPYCGPATGPCYGYGGVVGYPPYTGYASYAAYTPFYGAYVPVYTNAFGVNGCALGNYSCARNVGYVPWWWYR